MIRKHRETNLQTNPEGEITKVMRKLKGKIKVISIKFPEGNLNVSEETVISFENDLGITLTYPPNNKDFYDYPKINTSSGIFVELSEEANNTEQMTITGNLILKIRNAGANKQIDAIEIVLED